MIISSCDFSGQKLKYNESDLHYTRKVTKDDAVKLGEYLSGIGYFSNEPKEIQLSKKHNIWEIKIEFPEDKIKDEQFRYLLTLFARDLSVKVFNKEPLNLYLCNKQLEPREVIQYK
jgi:hypothetical protein